MTRCQPRSWETYWCLKPTSLAGPGQGSAGLRGHRVEAPGDRFFLEGLGAGPRMLKGRQHRICLDSGPLASARVLAFKFPSCPGPLAPRGGVRLFPVQLEVQGLSTAHSPAAWLVALVCCLRKAAQDLVKRDGTVWSRFCCYRTVCRGLRGPRLWWHFRGDARGRNSVPRPRL